MRELSRLCAKCNVRWPYHVHQHHGGVNLYSDCPRCDGTTYIMPSPPTIDESDARQEAFEAYCRRRDRERFRVQTELIAHLDFQVDAEPVNSD